MSITKDVVTDLLPLYEAGDASADSRALVEGFLREHPEFARTVRDARRAADLLRGAPAPADLDRLELDSLERTRALLKRRTWTLALALFFTSLPFAFAFNGGRVTFFMLRDEPGSALFLISAVYLWLQYARLQRRLRPTAL
jgi:anti-sigma factor RsiW